MLNRGWHSLYLLLMFVPDIHIEILSIEKCDMCGVMVFVLTAIKGWYRPDQS